MKKSERILFALVTITLGVLLVAWRGDIINVLMTVLGIALLVLGTLDLIERNIKIALLKLGLGVLSVVFGWLLMAAVAYVLATVFILLAVYLTFDFFKKGHKLCWSLPSLSLWIKPLCLTLMGVFLFLNNGGEATWAFIAVGALTVFLGAVLLLDAFKNDY